MSFFAGFSGEFGKQLASSRAEEADRAEQQAARETAILQHLTTSTDPEIASHAVTGLLDLAGPRKSASGLSGWLGKMAAHPALPTIRNLMAQGKQVEDKAPQAPRLNVQEGLSAMPGEATGVGAPPQAPPQMGPVDPDTPEPAMARVASTPPPAFASLGQPATMKTVPRQVFDTPEEAAAKQARATTRGGLQGKVDVMRGTGGQGPLSEEEQDLLFPDRRSLQAAGTIQGKQAPQGSLDNTGRALNPEGYYTTKIDPRDPQRPLYIPSVAPASVSNQAAINKRQSYVMYAGPDGKTPARWRVSRDGSIPAEFMGYIPQRGSYLPYVDETTGDITYQQAPAPMTPVPGGPGAGGPPSVPRGTSIAGPAVQAVPGVPGGGPPPAPGASSRSGAPPPQAGQSGPAGIAGGRKRTLKETEGAFIGPTGEPQIGQALYDAATGKYHSPQDPTQEAVGFIPGAEGAAITNNYAAANNTLVMIAAAMKELEAAGLSRDNDPNRAADLADKFYSGTLGDDPRAAAVASLTNLAALQGATQYVRSNSRSYQMFQTASVHLPRMPEERVAAARGIPIVGGLVTSRAARLAGSHGWDSFASMYEKLKQAQTIINQGKQELATLTGKTADRAVGGGGAPAPARAGSPPPAAAGSAVPPEIQQLLQGKRGKRITMEDGTVWVVDMNGVVRPGG